MFNHRRQRQVGSGASGVDGGPTSPVSLPASGGPGVTTPTDVAGSGSPSTDPITSTPATDSLPPPSSQPPTTRPISANPSTSLPTPSSRIPEQSVSPASTFTSTSAVEHSTLTIPPPPPSSTAAEVQSATPTIPSTSFTTIVTTGADGSVFTTTSALPTSLSTARPNSHQSNRGAIIAGTTTAAIVILLILLGVLFLYRRNKLRKLWDDIASRSANRGRRERKGLLEDEDFDDDLTGTISSRGGVGMRMYRDSDSGGHSRGTSAASSRFYPSLHLASPSTAYHPPQTPTSSFRQSSTILTNPLDPNASSASLRLSQSPAPSLFRARASESGSIFREEGVWPPPGEASEFVDPFIGHVKKVSEEMSVTGDFGRSVLGVLGDAGPSGDADATTSMRNLSSSPSPTTMTPIMARQLSSPTTAPPLSTTLVPAIPIGSSASGRNNPNAGIHDRSSKTTGYGGAGINLAGVSNSALVTPRTTAMTMTVPQKSHSRQSSSSRSVSPISGPMPLKSILKKSSSGSVGVGMSMGGGGGSPTSLSSGFSRSRSPSSGPNHKPRKLSSSGSIDATPTPVSRSMFSTPANTNAQNTQGQTSRSSTTRTNTSESMYSTSTADIDVTGEFGFVSAGSTPAPPLPSPPLASVSTRDASPGGSLPPGAARSITPGSRLVYDPTPDGNTPKSDVSFDRGGGGFGLGLGDLGMDEFDAGSVSGQGRVVGPGQTNSQPKVSSPLARALSGDANIFLRE